MTKHFINLKRCSRCPQTHGSSIREEQMNDNISINTGDVVFPTAWNDDVISFGEDYLSHGNIEITTGTEGNITFS